MSSLFLFELQAFPSHEDRSVPDETNQDANRAEAIHMEASHPVAPINEGESLSERIARIKRDEKEREVGESGAPTSGVPESSNTSSTAGSALRDQSDPQRSAKTTAAPQAQPSTTPKAATTSHVRADATVAAGASPLRGTGPEGQGAPGTDAQTAGSRLAAGESARVPDGTATGERVRVSQGSVIPESNDVMLGDQSSRKDGPKDTTNALPVTEVDKLKEDGSESPHDATSDGGSRQAMAHQQLKDAAKGADEDPTPPAFRAEAKARTI